MNNETLEILEEAQAICTEEDMWIQEAYAEDDQGNCVNPESPQAVKFCSWGAIQFVAHEHDLDATLALARITVAADEIFGMLPQDVNDVLGRDSVLRMYHLAIHDESNADVNLEEPTVEELETTIEKELALA